MLTHMWMTEQASWQTATTYQLVHSAVLLAASTLPLTGAAHGALGFSVASFATGITLFSGSVSPLYAPLSLGRVC